MFDMYLSVAQEQRELQACPNANEHLKNTQGSKIKYKFRQAHPLLRFVTEETVAFLFAIDVKQIYRIECWQHVVYVHAEGVSRFVSYGDFPPVITTEKPESKDFIYWRKRWVKKSKQRKAPEFWVRFYTQKFIEARSLEQLREWGNLIAVFKFLFEKANIERLRENYSYQRFLKLGKQNFISQPSLSVSIAK
ncbi:MAG: hypothetical protein QNJ54_19735 [Prochloraceae cyanobacterium]|nr:hypothetical protein [Prochloraceae cyanobacterium]